jgi:N-acetylmuramic acid 6-phosphate etherase
MTSGADGKSEKYLGIEGGGTRTIALLADGDGTALKRVESGPANLRLLTDPQLVRHLRDLAANFPIPGSLAIGLAGAWTTNDRKRIRSAGSKVWPGVPCYATNDLETAFAAACADGGPDSRQVLIVSGTGSACYSRNLDGDELKVGGWGHLLGDKGSGYSIGLRALKAAIYYYDRNGEWPSLGRRLLRALQLNEPDELVGWAQEAAKNEIARLAQEVLLAWQANDKVAGDIAKSAAHTLAEDAASCARRMGWRPNGQKANPVTFVLAGSVLLKQPRFAALVGRELRKLWPGARVKPLARESVWGAVTLAQHHDASGRMERGTRMAPLSVTSRKLSPTEKRNSRSMNLDSLPNNRAVELMLSEDRKIPQILQREAERISRAVELMVHAFRRGGRLFYIGAGTSGRLGVLDASECPPTFRTPPDMVQAIIAGGEHALRNSIEGAEDDRAAGARALEFRAVSRRDVVVGIAASGTTPFVWGALLEAKRRGAATILLCFNPFLDIPRAAQPTLVIAPNLGPELLTGSTRLKAGTATKLVLNIFTTLAMVRLGKVVGNLMVDLNPANVKLRERSIRIVCELTKISPEAARAALERSGWVIKKAIARLKRR